MLELFKFNSNQVRVIVIDNDMWIVAMDIAEILGYVDHSKMLNLVDSEDKKTINPQKLESAILAESFGSNTFRVSVINESGLYACIFGSTKPEAKTFKKWVTSELLPTVRKTGSYNTQSIQKQLPQRDTIEYIEATEKLNKMEDCILTRLLKSALVDELSLRQNNKLLPQCDVKKYTIVKVRAKELGYAESQIGDGSLLGRFVKAQVKPEFQEQIGTFKVWHYEINENLDNTIHAYFR